LQTDQTSLPWQEMREVVLASLPDSPKAAAWKMVWEEWDGRLSVDSYEAATFELFLAEMTKSVTKAKAPRSYEWALGKRPGPLNPYNFFCFRRVGHLSRLLREQPVGWFARPWSEEAAAAFHRAARDVVGMPGLWGDLRKLIMHHPLGRKWYLAPVFNFPAVPCGGDTDTINQASVLPLDPLAPADNIASLRAVFDVGAWENCRFVLPAGQSGNPLSPHYADLFPLWQRGDGVPIAWSPEAVRAATMSTLTLTPQR
jgi:penicillin amidase